MKRPIILLLLSLASFLLITSCSTEKPGTPVAKVEQSVVTDVELNASTNLNFFSEEEAARNWLENQILLEHAKNGDAFDPKILDVISDRNNNLLTVQLLIDSLLVRTIHISEDDIRSYYTTNLVDFIFEDLAALVFHIGFRLPEEADKAIELFRSVVGTPDSLLAIYNFDRQIIYEGRLISVLDEAIFQAQQNTYVGPIESEFGYHIFLVEHFFAKDEYIPLELVSKQISQRLFEQRRSISRAAIIDSLREVINVEVY